MNTRPSWNEIFIKIALEISKRSTCAKIQVGAVLVKENRIISVGYNGVSGDKEHCIDKFGKNFNSKIQISDNYEMIYSLKNYIKSASFKKEHRAFQLKHEIHAEINTILFAAKNGIATNESILYTTWSPCSSCAKAILQAGVKEVYYYNLYEDTNGVTFLKENDITCKQVKL